MAQSEMERAYRRREALTYPAVGLATLAILGVAHYTWTPIFFPLIGAVFGGAALLIVGPGRVFFPHAWRTFDAPRPSPALEEEARALARRMGLRLAALRVTPKHATYPSVQWRGRTATANAALRDLPTDERRFALARALAHAPGPAQRFMKAFAGHLVYVAWAAWLFDLRPLALSLGAVFFVAFVFVLAQAPGRGRTARTQAKEATGADAALAYWRHMQALGSPEARREIARLEAAAPLLPGSPP